MHIIYNTSNNRTCDCNIVLFFFLEETIAVVPTFYSSYFFFLFDRSLSYIKYTRQKLQHRMRLE